MNSAILSESPIIMKDSKGYSIMFMKGKIFSTFVSLHQAIVSVVKLFHVFHTDYPAELKNFFGFIDSTLFGFESEKKERSLVKKIELFNNAD